MNMKTKYHYILFAALLLLGAGCGDFLEESSQDEVRPGTVNDLEELMLGEGYVSGNWLFNYLDLLTDDVESNFSKATNHEEILKTGAAIFTWDRDMFQQMKLNNVPYYNTWENLYKYIKGCNVVLDRLEHVTGPQEKKDAVRAQALAMRAYYYFNLVNLFAQPYEARAASQNGQRGVPLILSSAVKDEFPVPATVREVYDRIEKDLLEALQLFDQGGVRHFSVYKASPLFAHQLLSRVYLYTGDWSKAIAQASAVIAAKPALMHLNDFYSFDDWTGVVLYDKEKGGVYNSDSPELIWGYSTHNEYRTFFYGVNSYIDPGQVPSFTVSKELEKLYADGDLRKDAYYNSYLTMNGWFPEKHLLVGEKSDKVIQNPTKGLRVAEAYLNRAEAKIRGFISAGDDKLRREALDDLNTLRRARFRAPYTDVDIKDGKELLDFCLDERRRELSFEDHRWFDLRRTGCPKLEHNFSIVEGTTKTYTLDANSPAYTLPIPQEVLERNPQLKNNR